METRYHVRQGPIPLLLEWHHACHSEVILSPNVRPNGPLHIINLRHRAILAGLHAPTLIRHLTYLINMTGHANRLHTPRHPGLDAWAKALSNPRAVSQRFSAPPSSPQQHLLSSASPSQREPPMTRAVPCRNRKARGTSERDQGLQGRLFPPELTTSHLNNKATHRRKSEANCVVPRRHNADGTPNARHDIFLRAGPSAVCRFICNLRRERTNPQCAAAVLSDTLSWHGESDDSHSMLARCLLSTCPPSLKNL